MVKKKIIGEKNLLDHVRDNDELIVHQLGTFNGTNFFEYFWLVSVF